MVQRCVKVFVAFRLYRARTCDGAGSAGDCRGHVNHHAVFSSGAPDCISDANDGFLTAILEFVIACVLLRLGDLRKGVRAWGRRYQQSAGNRSRRGRRRCGSVAQRCQDRRTRLEAVSIRGHWPCKGRNQSPENSNREFRCRMAIPGRDDLSKRKLGPSVPDRAGSHRDDPTNGLEGPVRILVRDR